MKNPLLILIVLFISIQARSQEGTYYYGANGKLNEQEADAYVMKSVDKGIGNRYKIISHARLKNNEWLLMSSEKICIKNEEVQIIRRKGSSPVPGKSKRIVENPGNGIYNVKEFYNDQLSMTANCSQLIPLHYEGLVTEYYLNGNKKSESMYKENMLQSNKNWYPDGTAYIDNIFYSTHTGPTYPTGNDGIENFMADRISGEKLPFRGGIQDEVILGAVVMETGTLEGIKIISGSLPSVNELFIEALKELPGPWGPATLNGEKVRYFIHLPFILKNNVVILEKFEITKDGRMILLNE
ncbi:MAG: energy transducer TonB [Bacteroidales bacterium]|nr:energy transducer TonB [Bacteroidales bacterium]